MAPHRLRFRRGGWRFLLDVSEDDRRATSGRGSQRGAEVSAVSKGFTRYVAATVGLVLLVGALLSLLFRGPGDAAAIWLSAGVCIAVQLAASSLGRLAGHNNVMARMGIGAILRLLTLVVYALLVAKLLMLPLTAALVSIAAFFFLTTLIEPLLIKP
jgi:hypothetical protein